MGYSCVEHHPVRLSSAHGKSLFYVQNITRTLLKGVLKPIATNKLLIMGRLPFHHKYRPVFDAHDSLRLSVLRHVRLMDESVNKRWQHVGYYGQLPINIG